jgi:hypothetical protein
MNIAMRFFQESILLSFLLVSGVCMVGVLVREIFIMRRQLKMEMGTKSRVKRHAGHLRRA